MVVGGGGVFAVLVRVFSDLSVVCFFPLVLFRFSFFDRLAFFLVLLLNVCVSLFFCFCFFCFFFFFFFFFSCIWVFFLFFFSSFFFTFFFFFQGGKGKKPHYVTAGIFQF